MSPAFDDHDDVGHVVGVIETYLGDDDCMVQAIRRSASKVEGDWETRVSLTLNSDGAPMSGLWSAVHKPDALSGEDERRTVSFTGDGGRVEMRKETYGLNASFKVPQRPPGKVDISSMLSACMSPGYIPLEPTITK
ncbi:MAG: hypothetical protein AAB557_04105 [Patescibacteria group bacterium]